ncbi:MAG TPA: hypothetical protein EYG86_01190 [Crocinitomicaceae bacterium]|nr:hypothetical protein [Crocinitomicaceae bacterium]
MILRKIILLLVVGFFATSLAFASDDQGGGEKNKVDDQGRKQGMWIYLGKDRPSAGYPEEGKIEEGGYKNDRKEGEWIKYHRDGVTRKLLGTYKNNRPNGPFIKYHPNGVIKEKGTWGRGKYEDSLQRYYENGVLEYSAEFNETGKENGKVQYFYPNGQVEFEYSSVDGVYIGKATRYYENGDVKEKITYSEDGSVLMSEVKELVNPPVIVNDPGRSAEKAPKINVIRTKGATFKKNGYNKVFNADDEIWQDGNFRNGDLWDGKVYEYDSDGILLKVKVFKSGVYHSDGQL